MVDKVLLENKLESLQRCISRIVSKSPKTSAALHSDFDLQDILVLNLERAVQNSVDIALHILSTLDEAPVPTAMTEAFNALRDAGIIDAHCADRMVKSVGFRNTAVHTYQKLDFDIVFNLATKHLDDFRSYAKQIVVYLDGDQP